MQLQVKHTVEQPLCLPLNYHHMLQSIIYHHLKLETMAYSSYVHEKGFFLGNRNFKLFTFSGLQGKYQVEDKKICFYEDVMFEVRSPEPLFIRILEENLKNQGITYFGQHYNNIVTTTLDNSVENDEIKIEDDDTATSVFNKLATLGVECLKEFFDNFDEAFTILKEELGDIIEQMYTGMEMEF